MANGILYIKIARKDIQGNDNTLSLQELTNLRLKFSDSPSPVDYPIVNITEYPSYYLYEVVKTDVTSSNNNVFNYYVSASFTGSIISPPSTGRNGISGSYNAVLGNSLGYFNPTYGSNLFGDTPNLKLNITASMNINGTVGLSSQQLFLHNGTTGQDLASSSIGAGSMTLSLSCSVNPMEGDNYWLETNYTGILGDSVYSSVRFLVTQSITPSTYSNLTVLEPYLTNNFNNSDCDVLINNVSENDTSTKFFEVLYNTGVLTPSNFNQIISQSAEYAQINDYNYNSRASTISKYSGARTLQQQANKWTSGDIGFGKTPSVQNLETYFAYFETMGGTSYELTNLEAIQIKYLIDKDGNVLTPSTSEPYYSNLLQNFETGKKVRLILNSGSNATPGVYPIVKTGLYPRPTIWSQSGSDATSYSSIEFGTSGVPDFTNTILLGTGSCTDWINIMNTSGSVEVIGSTNMHTTFKSSSLQSVISYMSASATSTQTVMSFQVSAYLRSAPDLYHPAIGTLQFQITSASILLYDSVTSHAPDLSFNFIGTKHFNWKIKVPSEYSNPVNGYKYAFYLQNWGGGWKIDLLPGATINAFQSPGAVHLTRPYWVTGSSGILIAASASMGSAISELQTSPTSSGYIGNIPLTFEKFDEIRFGGDETQVYTIIDPNYNPNYVKQNQTILLDRPITLGTDVNSFFIRRYVQSPTALILNTGVPTGGGIGFAFPEYVSLDIQNSFDNIIKNLKEKGLIPT